MAKTKVHGEFLKDSVVRFTAKAGENITKGQAVYISGISGEVPVVSLADADDTAKMPAFGLAEATVSTNAEVEITSFGTLKGLDTSSYSLGDILYVDTTAGSLTNNPSGLEATKLQNIGIVQRVHASNGSIKVGGAGRTNAVPNLDDGDIFIGDSNNKAISDSFTNVLNTEAGISVSGSGIDVTGTVTADGLTVNSSEVLFDNTGGDFTLKLNTNAVSDKNEIIMGDSGTPLAKFGVGGTANDIITGSDGQDFNIGTAGGGRAINFSTDNFASVEMKLDGGNLGIGFTSPQAKLQVLDQLKVSTSDQSQGVVALGDGSSTQFGVGIARWNGSTNSGGAGGLGYFSQGTINSGGHFFYTGDAAAGSTTERMRIDSSGNLLVGKTTGASATAGHRFNPNGSQESTASGTQPLYLNRLSSDGNIIVFDKDNSTVGSIKNFQYNEFGLTSNNNLVLQQNTTTQRHLVFSNSYFSSFGSDDGTIDLGRSVARYKDLYLSGGAYLGGTGSANYLDDYEEGTWTVSLTPSASGSITMNSGRNTMKYTKVGRLVTITGRVNIASVSSPTGSVQFNLPFTTSNTGQTNSNYATFLIVTHGIDTESTTQYVMAEAGNNTTTCEWREVTDNDDWPSFPATSLQGDGNEWFYIKGSFTTDA